MRFGLNVVRGRQCVKLFREKRKEQYVHRESSTQDERRSNWRQRGLEFWGDGGVSSHRKGDPHIYHTLPE